MTDTPLFSRRRLLSLFAFAVPAPFVAAPSRADEYFAPPKISAFTGTEWGGLTFGKTTQEAIKRDWKNGRGDFRNSVELQTQNKSPYKISALFPNVEKSATLDGIVIRWRDDNHDGLPLSELQNALGGAPDACQIRHSPTRYQDWRIAFWPKPGVMALVLNDRAAWALLGKPEKIAALASRFSDAPSEIVPLPDPGQGKAKEVVYGKVAARFDLKGITMDHQKREQDDMESDLRRAGNGDSRALLRYDRGADGEYTLSIYARARDNKDTDGRVTAHITGTTVYGKVDVSADATFRIDKNQYRLNDTALYRAVRDAQRGVEDRATRAVKAQGPPSADALRSQQWHKIVEDYRVLPVGPASDNGDKSGNSVGGGLL